MKTVRAGLPTPAEATTVQESGEHQRPDLEMIARRERTSKHRTTLAVNIWRIVLFIGFVAVWQLGSGRPGDRGVFIDAYFVSRPSEIIDTFLKWCRSGELFDNTLVTLQEMILGFVIGAVSAILLGILFGVNEKIARIFNPFVTAVYSIPRLALVPLFLLWFGLGLSSKIVYIVVVVFFQIFYNTYSGVRDVDSELTAVLRVMGGRRRHIFGKAILPAAMTWIITGLRISVPHALVAAVTAEILASNQGLGYLLIRSTNQFFMSGVFASIVAMVLLSLMLSGVVNLLEHFTLRWKRSMARE